jgi:hypothetical protein
MIITRGLVVHFATLTIAPCMIAASIVISRQSPFLGAAKLRRISPMRPLGIVGILLIIGGAAILAFRGVSYTKERQSVQVGPLGITAERKGFIPPIVGVAAIVLGGVLVFAARKRS